MCGYEGVLSGYYPPTIENQMENRMGNEMEIGIYI